MALSPEAIIAMIALFVACTPGLKSIIIYYKNKARREQNRIQNIQPSQPETLNSIVQTLVPPQAPNSSHDPREETITRPIVLENYRFDAVLLDSSPSAPESMSPSSRRADPRLPPQVHLLESLYGLLQRYDVAILWVSQAAARTFLARRVAIPSDEENQRLTGSEANIIELDERDQQH